jgi:hypothetical protein
VRLARSDSATEVDVEGRLAAEKEPGALSRQPIGSLARPSRRLGVPRAALISLIGALHAIGSSSAGEYDT